MTSHEEIACTLDADALRKRKEELRTGILGRVRGTRTLSDGLAFELPLSATSEAEAREFIEFESGCCGFARYAIERDPAQETLWLEIRGPEGTAEFVRSMLPANDAAAEPASPSRRTGRDPLRRFGFAGGGAAIVAFLCCATPALGWVLGLVGLAGAQAAIGAGVDAVAFALLLASGAAIGWSLWRARRRAREAARVGSCAC